MNKLKLNTTQLRVLRHVGPMGRLACDNSTGKALVERGYAMLRGRDYFITLPGLERARHAADRQAHRDGFTPDPSLMEDLK